MATTTNYGWTTPDDTALVKDGAAAIRTLGSSVDTTTKALNPSTTLGDIEYRSSTANTNTRLGIGTTGQILTVAGGVPSWAAPAASGGMTLINTGGTTLTGASVTISSIPATYKNLQVIVQNYKPTTDGDFLLMRFNSDSTGNYSHGHTFGGADNVNVAGSSVRLTQASDNSVANGIAQTDIYQYSSTASAKIGWLLGATNNQSTTTNYNFYSTFWVYKDTTAISSITFLNDTGGNFTSGTAYIYGVS